MRRRTFDVIASAGGAVLTIVLLMAGVLLLWGHDFADHSVRSQLAAQQVYFPPKGSPALASPQIGPYLDKYAGEQLVNGRQAQAYADHFIAVHLQGVAGGQTYAQVSGKAVADPTNAALAAQANTLFKGEALRSMLLTAYAFWKIGQIALLGAVSAFALAGVMALLTILGLVHLRTVPVEAELLGDRIVRPRTEAMAH